MLVRYVITESKHPKLTKKQKKNDQTFPICNPINHGKIPHPNITPERETVVPTNPNFSANFISTQEN